MKAMVYNIQKFSIHDGPGIRTVVFFKGCPLRCLWCSNPESQTAHPQLFWNQEKCSHCRKCETNCPDAGIRFVDDRLRFQYQKGIDYQKCVQQCPTGALESTGQLMTLSEIMDAVKKDMDFYEESGGGVTLSGGEVLVWSEFAGKLLQKLHAEKIHSAIETTGYAAEPVFQSIAANADLLLFDLKHHNNEKHRIYTGVPNTPILQNMKWAIKQNIPLLVRIPVIPTVNDHLTDAAAFCTLLKEIGAKQVELLPFHQFGQKKYELLQLEYAMKDIKTLHPEDLTDYKEIFEQSGFEVKL